MEQCAKNESSKPTAVLTRTGKIPVNTARTSGTNTVNTARRNFHSQAVPINAARKVNTVKPIVNNAKPKAGFHKSVSPFRKSFSRTTTLRTKFSKPKVNIAEVNAVSAVKGKRETAVKSLADSFLLNTFWAEAVSTAWYKGLKTKQKTQYEVDWYEVSRRLRGMLSLVDPAGVRGYSQNSKAYVVLNKHTMKVEESLNVTFDESPPPTKLSPLVDDDVGEEESI
ncbi:hypothetical protein Tco_0240545 [Tanacetum coccineum]